MTPSYFPTLLFIQNPKLSELAKRWDAGKILFGKGSKQAIHHSAELKSKDGSRQSDFSIKILTGLENWFSHTLERPTESDKIIG